MEMKYSVFIFIFLSCFFGFFGTIGAQGFGLNETINVEMIPLVPKAGESVHVTLVSYLTDINMANIIWTVNGKTIKSGTGIKEFDFIMGGDGQTTTLGIIVKTTSEGTIEKSFSLKPASVDLIWQSNGVVPPFYKGKSLFSHQNEVTVVALPHVLGKNGTEINPKNFSYTWKKNGSVIEEASGYGKNTYTFEGSIISRPLNIGVEATSLGNEGVVYGSINLKPTDPTVIFYKKDPVYGIEFQKAIGANQELMDSDEISVIGIPLFFNSNNKKGGGLVFTWSINGVPIDNGGYGQAVQTFRKVTDTGGSSNISLSIENREKILQFKSSAFNLTFSGKNN